MIRNKKINIKKVAWALFDAKPQLVSLVDHGANQTPFAVVKNVNGTEIAEENMPEHGQEQTQKIAATSIRAIHFDASEFNDTDSVNKWLESKGFVSDAAVEEVEKGFVIKGDSYDETSENFRSLEADSGVTIDVVELGADEQDDSVTDVHADAQQEGEQKDADRDSAEDEVHDSADSKDTQADDETQKSDEGEPTDEATDKVVESDIEEGVAKGEQEQETEQTYKLDEFMASMSPGTTIADVMADGDDGLPVGFNELAVAMVTALRNASGERDEQAIRSIASDFGEKYIQLMGITPQVVEQKSQGITKDDVMQAVKEATSELSRSIKEDINSNNAEVGEQLEALSKSVSEVAGRVSVLEKVKQTRKGADIDEAGVDQQKNHESTQKEQENREYRTNQLKSVIGL